MVEIVIVLTAKALNEARVHHLIKDEQTRTSICCQNDYSLCALFRKRQH